MPKFHDEFFRKSTPDHDELVAITLENLENIFDGLFSKVFSSEYTHTFYICHENETPFCTLEGRSAWRTKQCCYNYTSAQGSSHYCKYFSEKHQKDKYSHLNVDDIKEFFSDVLDEQYGFTTNKYPAETIAELHPSNKEISCICTLLISDVVIEKETESICRSGNFIIGYVDVVAIIDFDLKRSAQLDDNWTWDDFSTSKKSLILVIDAKPKLKSWGGPLRQIKTYMDIIKNEPIYKGTKLKGVFTTFSEVPERYRKILEAEGVYVVTFSRDGVIAEYSSPVQTKLGEVVT